MINKLKEKRGITLIALIITIIVLLILAGISINMITSQDGILSKAISAKEKQKIATKEEKIKLALQTAMANENAKVDLEILNKELELIGIEEKIESLPAEITIDDKTYKITENGISKSEGTDWYINGTNVTNGKVSIPLGTTINYDPFTGVQSTKLTIESKKEKNGQKDQTYTIENNDKQKLQWKVWGTDDDGNILIMPTTNVKDKDGNIQKLAIGGNESEESGCTDGQNAVLYANGEVDKLCSIYGYGKGAKSATSIKVENINKITGFKPEESSGFGYGWKWEYKLNEEDGNVWYKNEWDNDFKKPEYIYTAFTFFKEDENKWISLNKGQSTIVEGKWYTYEISGRSETNEIEKLIINSTDSAPYWLGSSFVYTDNCTAGWGLYHIESSKVDLSSFFMSGNSPYSFEYGLRPVVSLEKDVTFTPKKNENNEIVSYDIN